MPARLATAGGLPWLQICLSWTTGAPNPYQVRTRANAMIYEIYEAQSDIGNFSRLGANAVLSLLKLLPAGTSDKQLRRIAAALELISRAALTYKRPAYGIDTVKVANGDMAVIEEVVHRTPFCSLLHFKKGEPIVQPRVLLVA